LREFFDSCLRDVCDNILSGTIPTAIANMTVTLYPSSSCLFSLFFKAMWIIDLSIVAFCYFLASDAWVIIHFPEPNVILILVSTALSARLATLALQQILLLHVHHVFLAHLQIQLAAPVAGNAMLAHIQTKQGLLSVDTVNAEVIVIALDYQHHYGVLLELPLLH